VPVDFHDDSQSNLNPSTVAIPDDHYHYHLHTHDSTSMNGDSAFTSSGSSCPFLKRQSTPPAHLRAPSSSSGSVGDAQTSKELENKEREEVDTKTEDRKRATRSDDLNHCYVLNGATDYQLAWSLRSGAPRELGKKKELLICTYLLEHMKVVAEICLNVY